MPSGRKKNKRSARQERPTPLAASPTSPIEHGHTSAQDAFVLSAADVSAPSSPSSPTRWKHFERASSSFGGADADEEMGHSGGHNTNGATSASPPPSTASSGSEASAAGQVHLPAAPPLSTADILLRDNAPSPSTGRVQRHHDATNSASSNVEMERAAVADHHAEAKAEALMMAADDAGVATADSASDIFYVQLDPDSQVVTGVLPEMEQLHVQLTQLRRVLRQSGAVLHALRQRARAFHDDACELRPSPPPTSAPHSQTRRRAGPGGGTSPTSQLPSSARNSARAVARTSAERGRPSPRFAPQSRPGNALSTPPLAPTSARVRRHGDGEHDEESEWCDAATMNTSTTTTAHSTPSLHPALAPPPAFHFFEEDEIDDDGRGSHISSIMGVRRTYAARFRPDSVPSSMHSTPNMLPATTGSYARSDGGGVLCLPPSTSSIGRSELPRQLSLWNPAATSPTAASPSGSVMSRLENSPLLPLPASNSARAFDQRDTPSISSREVTAAPPPSTDEPRAADVAAAVGAGDAASRLGRLSEAERTELARLSRRVAELYHRRGLLLLKADRILCQHAQQHERWEGNEERRGCYRCRRLFSRLTRRHHCRRCGRLCCAECSRYVGKKQDTSYVAPNTVARGTGAPVAHRVIIKSEYTARMTADDAHTLAEEAFDEHTYPRRGTTAASEATSVEGPADAVEEEEEGAHHARDTSFSELTASPESRAGRPRQHKWVRVCAPCYQNCLRARRNNVLQYLKNANLCILDDGYYYYHVMTKEELCQLSTALSKPDSFKKQVELMSHVVMERSVDYVAAAPAYSAQTLANAVQHTPDVLRTLGGISAYAFRSARQTANDYVGGYFATSRTIMPDNPVGAATLSSLSVDQDTSRSERHNGAEEECSEASVESLDDTCSETQSPGIPGDDHDDEHGKSDEDAEEDV